MGPTAYDRLRALGLPLRQPVAAVALFTPVVRSGTLLFVSGHVARREGQFHVGQLGGTLTTEDGRLAARDLALDLIGTLHAATGDLEGIQRIVKLLVLVNSSPTFTEHHLVANGASQLFLEVFGERGAHARSAFGVAQIPFGGCVEIELIAELYKPA